MNNAQKFTIAVILFLIVSGNAKNIQDKDEEIQRLKIEKGHLIDSSLAASAQWPECQSALVANINMVKEISK